MTDLVTANPTGDYSLGQLARHLNVSTRQLTRLFHDELATTPARYVETIRLDLARALLDQGHTATQAATLAGFPSYESLRRVFARNLSTSPAAYQRRLARPGVPTRERRRPEAISRVAGADHRNPSRASAVPCATFSRTSSARSRPSNQPRARRLSANGKSTENITRSSPNTSRARRNGPS